MQTVSFIVKPNIPDRLKPLEEMANNLWLSWNFDAVQLFMRLDYEVWLASRQNPARTLGRISQARLEEIAQDSSFLAAMDAVYGKYQKYLQGERWYKKDGPDVVAYFSMEYGLDVSLPIYSGGWVCCPGIISRPPRIWACPWWGSGFSTGRGTFSSI